MNRLVWILLSVTACVASGGDEGFNIVNNRAPAAGCTISTGGGIVGRGVIDQDSLNPYVFTPEIISRISADGTEAQRTIVIQGAKVEVTAPGGPTLTNNKFTSLFAASIPPGGTITAAFDITTAAILSQIQVSGAERVQLLAKITPFGELGGSDVDGVEFEYPISVCASCVAPSLGTCPLMFGTTIVNQANPCNSSQDGFVTCCMQNGVKICPGVADTEPPPV
jgi:hypothetical protein